MPMYMSIIFEMEIIYMHHMDDFDIYSEKSVSKSQERMCGIIFHCLLKLIIDLYHY